LYNNDYFVKALSFYSQLTCDYSKYYDFKFSTFLLFFNRGLLLYRTSFFLLKKIIYKTKISFKQLLVRPAFLTKKRLVLFNRRPFKLLRRENLITRLRRFNERFRLNGLRKFFIYQQLTRRVFPKMSLYKFSENFKVYES